MHSLSKKLVQKQGENARELELFKRTLQRKQNQDLCHVKQLEEDYKKTHGEFR